MKEYLSSSSYINLVTHRLVHYENSDEEVSHRLTAPESNIVLCLLKQQNTLVKKEVLFNAGWGSQIVGDNSLNVAIYRIRKFLSDNQRISLENVPKVGYRLVIEQNNPLQPLNDFDNDSPEQSDKVHSTSVKDHSIFIETSDLNAKRKPFFIKRDMVLVIVLLLVNILIVQFYVIVIPNTVSIQCNKSSSAMICFSDEYDGDVESERSGLSVVSNLFSFNNDVVDWNGK